MVFRVAVSREEFKGATAGGDVYGQYAGRGQMCVYVELGEEGIYRASPSDDPQTEYRIFFNCNVYLAPTMKMLEAGADLGRMKSVSVIIYS